MGLPALRDLPIFEVDHPATSAVKRKQIEELDASISQVAFVPVDFDREQLSDALSNAGFQGKRRTRVIWEGVTNYLTAAAVDATLRWIGSLAEGSRLIFTYVDADVLGGSNRFKDAARPPSPRGYECRRTLDIRLSPGGASALSQRAWPAVSRRPRREPISARCNRVAWRGCKRVQILPRCIGASRRAHLMQVSRLR
jgi:methyltransferase (TIGR00027 family)